jgi:beta-N-acetylhexosaminidase
MADRSLQERNIRSPEQVRELVHSLRARAKTPLWVAIDQEGGRVNRLKPKYGFPETLSHAELGAADDPEKTHAHALEIAQTLAGLGINLNLAPVVDVDANPDNPIICGKGRSFSSDPETVAWHAAAFARAHRELGILTCAKHFPGHGSARGDTHLGLVDVTAFWTDAELVPFQRLIHAALCPMIMSAHVFNARLDAQHPATLSRAVLTGILRERLGFQGVILSDDMEMEAIGARYGLEKAIELAIEAGVDVLCFGNNLKFDATIVARASDIMVHLVEQGTVPESRIDESLARIMALKEGNCERK